MRQTRCAFDMSEATFARELCDGADRGDDVDAFTVGVIAPQQDGFLQQRFLALRLDGDCVAAALELKAARFWTFDGRQKKLARATGLETA